MAKKASRPGRRLMIFGLLTAVLYAGVALGGQWTPKLGLDLQGGTRITLEASTATGESITPEKLAEARGIIDQRVNGQGVAEAEVAVQGDRNIVVEIPGQNAKNLVDAVKQTAQLRFRLVAAVGAGQPAPSPSASPSDGASGSASDNASPEATASPDSTKKPKASASPKNRALSGGLLAADGKKKDKKKSDKPSPTAEPSAAPSPAAPSVTQQGAPVDQPLKWMDNPGEKWLKKFAAYTCPKPGEAAKPVADVKDKPLITCDSDGVKYLLSASVIQGTQLTKAEAGIPAQQVQWVVDLTFDKSARQTFADVTRAIVNETSPITGQQKQFAIVLDGQVISAPVVNGVIPNGQAQISGDFTQQEAQTLANSLKYGALPLTFTAPSVTEEGPTLAADQLSGGLWAGGIGLLLVIVYCLIYYRGLGIVVVASLGVAGIVTYAVVLAMSQAVNFTLTLPGIAGLIVAVGITADSFIVYFERIRDEMRDGRSMRVAVESGWTRARNTCLAADAVSLLAAVVLYIFAIGVVKGFAFALGISTLIDLLVFFMFTKPMVSWLATFKFFNTGHKFSGLSAETIGIDRIAPSGRPSVAGGTR
ncbi:MAG: protein translocase subunit SecD [Nocardioides sp.]